MINDQPLPKQDVLNLQYTTDVSLRLPIDNPYSVLSVASVGDIMFGNHALSYLREHGSIYPFLSTYSILKNADITLGNLEGPFTNSETRFDKKYTFKIPPRYANGLKEAGFDVLTLANNHLCDYGIAGVESTIDVLNAIGVAHCGAGLNISCACEPAIIERNGFRIAVFGYSMTYPVEFWATDSTGGTCYPYRYKMQNDIEAIESIANLTIVNFHWGSELSHQPKQYQKEWARLAIDSGADLIVGHHPHVLQGIEIYKNRIIAYSLGNFSFASYSKKATESMILKAYFSETGFIYGKIIPVSVNNIDVAFQPVVLFGAEADSVIKHMQNYSKSLNNKQVINDSGFIWNSTVPKVNQTSPFTERIKK